MRQVVLPTALVLTLCNMDRICMAVAMPAIAREMSWAPSTQARTRADKSCWLAGGLALLLPGQAPS